MVSLPEEIVIGKGLFAKLLFKTFSILVLCGQILWGEPILYSLLSCFLGHVPWLITLSVSLKAHEHDRGLYPRDLKG